VHCSMLRSDAVNSDTAEYAVCLWTVITQVSASFYDCRRPRRRRLRRY